jgi:hypothetical protein
LGYLKVTVDPEHNTATAQEIFVAQVEQDNSETATVYHPSVTFDTITFPLHPGSYPHVALSGLEPVTTSGSQAALATATGTGLITIDTSLNPGTSIRNARAVFATDPSLSQARLPSGYDFRDGVVAGNIIDVSPGSTITVALTFSRGIPEGSKVYSVHTDGFWEFTNATVHGNAVSLALTDGGEGDNDQTQDGTIVLVVGIAIPTN